MGTFIYQRLLPVGAFWLLLATMGLAASNLAADTKLIMFEQDGCHYCEVWSQQVGVTYHKSPEGQFAPLERRDIGDGPGEGVKPVVFTPTFVLVSGGKEVGRLTGYISEDFFWGLLAPMLKKQGFTDSKNGGKS